MIRIIMITAATLFMATSVTAEMSDIPYHGEGHIMLNASELEWSDVPSMAPGAQMAIIEGDLSKEAPFTFRLKVPDGYNLAPHTHPAYERVTVLSGTLHFAHGEEFDRTKTQALKPGGVAIMPPGEPMFGYAEEETIIQLHGTGPWGIKYVNPEDDPRS
jgi:quercetin dioxygenase-like cupin family protein